MRSKYPIIADLIYIDKIEPSPEEILKRKKKFSKFTDKISNDAPEEPASPNKSSSEETINKYIAACKAHEYQLKMYREAKNAGIGAVGELLTHISPIIYQKVKVVDQFEGIKSTGNAPMLWKIIEKAAKPTGNDKLMTVAQNLTEWSKLKQGSEESIYDYVSRYLRLTDNIYESIKIARNPFVFVNSLNEKFDKFKIDVALGEQLKENDLPKVCQMVFIFASQSKIDENKITEASLAASNNFHPGTRINNQKHRINSKKFSTKKHKTYNRDHEKTSGMKSKSSLYCIFCKRENHSVVDCYELKREQENNSMSMKMNKNSKAYASIETKENQFDYTEEDDLINIQNDT